MGKNGYELRHDLLNEARDMLFQGWYKKCEVAQHNAHTEKRAIAAGEMPEPPVIKDILALAGKMNEFVGSLGPITEQLTDTAK